MAPAHPPSIPSPSNSKEAREDSYGEDDTLLSSSPTSPSCESPQVPFAGIRRGLTLALTLVLLLALLSISFALPTPSPIPSTTTIASPPSRVEQAIKYREAFHAPAQFKLDSSRTLVREATAEHAVTAILLHGLGDAPHQLPFFDWLGERFPYVRWVSPQARNLNVAVRGNASVPGWYDIATFADLYYVEDVEGMIESQRELNELVQEERRAMEEKGKEPRIVVAGFSQGAVMTLLLALTAEEQLEGAIILSGYLPLLNASDIIGPFAARDTPIFWGHGSHDPYLTLAHATESVAILRKDFSMRHVVLKTYKGLQHFWRQDEMQDVANWFGENIPQEPRRNFRLPAGGRYTGNPKPAFSEAAQVESPASVGRSRERGSG